MRLITAEGKEVQVGDILTSYRGEEMMVFGIEEPKHPNSSGRIYATDKGQSRWAYGYFPTVFNCKWAE